MKTRRLKTSGLVAFRKRWAKTAPLAADAIEKIARGELRSLKSGEYLARRGEEAHCTWIIESGELDIDSPRIQRRVEGDLVGEAGLLQPGTPRSSDMVAQVPSQVWCIKREDLENLSDAQRADVLMVVATSLFGKLSQSVEQRQSQRGNIGDLEDLLSAFVPPSGLGIIRANLHPDSAALEPFVSKRAVVFFSDLAGFSKLSKQLSPQETGNAIIELQTPVIQAISENGGELDKLVGDGAMALWLSSARDVPVDKACKAVMAAAQAVQGVRALARRKGWPDIDLRVGVHCGDVVVGDFGAQGRRTFTAIGPVVNTAARYEQAREASDGTELGPVRISPSVYSRLDDKHKALFAVEYAEFHEKSPPPLKVHSLRIPLGAENGLE